MWGHQEAGGGLMSGTLSPSPPPLSAPDELLKRFGLTSVARGLPAILEQARQQQWTYDTFLQQALVAEEAGRAERAYQRRLRAAHLPASKSLESFDFAFQPSVSQRLLEELGTLGFVQTATNVVFLGPPGVGKTHPPHYPSRSHVLADRCGHGH
jgi:DNA replication protein DnaC